jgi:hypothetical protein
MPIQPDDLEPGAFVASTQCLHNYAPGTPFYITSVSLPFIAVRAVNSTTSLPFPILVDSLLYKISDSYVREFFPSPTAVDHSTLRGYSVKPEEPNDEPFTPST